MTQLQSIREHLSDGHTLTHLEAQKLFGCARLAARIGEAKELGDPIGKTMIEVQRRDGSWTRVAQYYRKAA